MSLDKAMQDELIHIVRRAGQEIVMSKFRQLDLSDVATKSSLSDLVTIADHASEEFISTQIKQSFPNWAIVGEEAVAEDPKTTDLISSADTCVIIDPIDGTWNFAHGLSDFGIILAVVEKGVTQFGLLYDPVNDDWIYSHLGQGAYFQRTLPQEKGDTTVNAFAQPPKPLTIQAQTELTALAGIMSIHAYTGEKLKDFALKATHFARINNLPSCPAYRMLAQGHFHFTLTYKMMPWDHAAGVLIYQEAGGVCRTLDGKEYQPTLLDGEMLAAQSEQQWQALAKHFREN
ncbi:inositol monophosphatase family protein [Marinomonas epiphytica]